MPTIDSWLIGIVHDILSSEDVEEQEKEQNTEAAKLGEKLPMRSIGFFLEMCHNKITSPQLHRDLMVDLVKAALAAAEIDARHSSNTIPADLLSFWATSKDETKELNQAEMRMLLCYIRDYAGSIETMLRKVTDSLIEQHGGILQYASMRELLNKVTSSTDTGALLSLMEQIGALHGTTCAAKLRPIAREFEEFRKILEEGAKIIESKATPKD